MEQEIVQIIVETATEHSLYIVIGIVCAMIASIVFTCAAIHRCIRLFMLYIQTGKVGKTDDCILDLIIGGCDRTKLWHSLWYATHPGGIFIDTLILGLFTLLLIPTWAPILAIAMLITIAFFIRKRIAKKQAFVAKLDGTHPDIGRRRQSDDFVQGSP